METTLLIVLVALTALTLILSSVSLLRPRGDAALREKLDALRGDSERVDVPRRSRSNSSMRRD